MYAKTQITVFNDDGTIKFHTRIFPTSEDERQAEIKHFTHRKNWMGQYKRSPHERRLLKRAMYAHPTKHGSPKNLSYAEA